MINIVIESLIETTIILVFIICVVVCVCLIWRTIEDMKEKKNNGSCNVIEESEDICNEWRAIIVLGDEKIEIEVDNYDIDDNIVEIESVDGRVFITDIKNVLLMSEDESIQMESLT